MRTLPLIVTFIRYALESNGCSPSRRRYEPEADHPLSREVSSVPPKRRRTGGGPQLTYFEKSASIACPVGPADPTGSLQRSLCLNVHEQALSPKMENRLIDI